MISRLFDVGDLENDTNLPVEWWQATRDRCWYCASPRQASGFDCEHVLPVKWGGAEEHKVMACATCNQHKARLFDSKGPDSGTRFIESQFSWSISCIASFFERAAKSWIDFSKCHKPDEVSDSFCRCLWAFSEITHRPPVILMPRSVEDHVVRILWLSRFVFPPCIYWAKKAGLTYFHGPGQTLSAMEFPSELLIEGLIDFPEIPESEPIPGIWSHQCEHPPIVKCRDGRVFVEGTDDNGRDAVLFLDSYFSVCHSDSWDFIECDAFLESARCAKAISQLRYVKRAWKNLQQFNWAPDVPYMVT